MTGVQYCWKEGTRAVRSPVVKTEQNFTSSVHDLVPLAFQCVSFSPTQISQSNVGLQDDSGERMELQELYWHVSRKRSVEAHVV